jgi:hypothetical protein
MKKYLKHSFCTKILYKVSGFQTFYSWSPYVIKKNLKRFILEKTVIINISY